MLLAVSPLHVYLSAQALPDAIAIFFIFCSLAAFARVLADPSRTIPWGACGAGMALALLSKATALYVWGFLALVGPVFLRGRRVRTWWCATWLTALVPLAAMVAVIKWQGNPLTFFEQPTVSADFRVDAARIGQQAGLFVRFFAVDLLPMAAGVWVAWKRDRRWLAWLALLGLIAVTPTFRVNARELLYILPAAALFWGLAVEMVGNRKIGSAALGCVAVASLLLDCWGIPVPALGPSLSDRTIAILDRPSGWPSREAARWLQAHLNWDEAILITGLGFTDPLVIQIREAGTTLYAAPSNWERLRDPANRIKYAVFMEDHRAVRAAFGPICRCAFFIRRRR